MLAEQNNFAHEVAVTMRELTADEKIRLQCEARERYKMDKRSILASGIRQGEARGEQRGEQRGIEKQKQIDAALIAEKEAVLTEKVRILSEKDKEINELRKQLNELSNSHK